MMFLSFFLWLVSGEACSLSERGRHGSLKVLQQRGKLVIQFDSYLGDLGCVEAAESGAGLVHGEPSGAVGVFHDGGAEGCIQQDGWVVAVHSFRNGVVAHQVLDTTAAVSGQTHQRREVVGPIENKVVWRVVCGGLQYGLPVDAPLDERVEPCALKDRYCSLIAIPEPIERAVDLDRQPVDLMGDRFDRSLQ